MAVDERLQELAGDERSVSREHEHVARNTVERAARRCHCVAGAARLFLDGHEWALRSPKPAAVSGDATTTSGSGPSGSTAASTQSTIRRPSSG